MLNLSIVIPLYNKAQSIKQTIECIQAQTYQNWEIVILDTDADTLYYYEYDS